MELVKKLIKVQSGLKAPKGQFNSFGKYHYRSCEDILEAVKPLLVSEGILLTITDEIVMIGDRIYVKAEVSVTDGKDTISKSAYAREENEKKGMDGSQITGAASSYARKYALNGLFCIDDNKESDATNVGVKAEQSQENALIDVAMADVKMANSVEALKGVWMNYQSLHNIEKFKSAVNKKKDKLNGVRK